MLVLVSSRRSTRFSPWMDGIVEARMLMSLFFILTVKRPSWGTRDRAMSMLARIFSREMMGRNMDLGGAGTSCSLPSTRKRICTWSFSGLMWMSLAPSRTL